MANAKLFKLLQCFRTSIYVESLNFADDAVGMDQRSRIVLVLGRGVVLTSHLEYRGTAASFGVQQPKLRQELVQFSFYVIMYRYTYQHDIVTTSVICWRRWKETMNHSYDDLLWLLLLLWYELWMEMMYNKMTSDKTMEQQLRKKRTNDDVVSRECLVWGCNNHRPDDVRHSSSVDLWNEFVHL
jgi:hypothetical protein